jgi:hypothetical protein
LRLPAYSASAKVICFIGKLGGWGRGILPNQKVFFRVSLEAQRDISHYLMHRYNWIRPHQFNDGLPPAVAEENLTHYPGWIDHYRPSKALANRDHSFPPKPAQANALLVPLLAALDVPGIRFVYSR